jgi:hypothetical protein
MPIATVTFKDQDGGMSTIRIPVDGTLVPDLATVLSTVVPFYKTNSAAKVVGYGLHEGASGDTFTEGKYDHVDQKLAVLWVDVNGNHRFCIPAPIEGIVDTKQQVAAAFATVFKTFLVTTVGALDADSWEYLGGGITSKLPSKEERNLDMA